MDVPERTTRLASVREGYIRFVANHAAAWEITMAVLAVVYVIVGFAREDAPAEYQGGLASAETFLTAVFVAEFFSRLLASRERRAYLRRHWIDAVALIPVARGLRVFRLIRLLRLVRAFAGLNRVITGIERLADHRGTGTLVVALVATVMIASAAFFAVETGSNPKVREPADAVWWGISTLTGGTTDISAVTDEGRAATVALLVLGVALLTAITATIVSFVLNSGRETKALGVDESPLGDLTRLRDHGVITDLEFAAFVARVARRL